LSASVNIVAGSLSEFARAHALPNSGGFGCGSREHEVMKNGCGEYPYVDHLLAEHRRLDQLIRRTLASLPCWEESDVSAWTPRMVAGLEAIRRELAQHFREEEAGGCLEEAVARCPALSSEVRQIEGEHQGLLGALDELILSCQRLTQPTARDAHALGQELRALVHRLRAHEALENRIMQRGFGISLEHEETAEEARPELLS
jgi:Hemerythrin HHE cation binding domain